jgi:hypothetical protein
LVPLQLILALDCILSGIILVYFTLKGEKLNIKLLRNYEGHILMKLITVEWLSFQTFSMIQSKDKES